MATFELPDGRTATLPDTMTREEMTAALNSLPPLPKEEKSFLGKTLDRAQALGAGFNQGAPDLLSLPVERVLDVYDLGKIAIGAPVQALTGKVQDWAEPTDRSKVVGSNADLTARMNNLGLPTDNPAPDDTASRYLYNIGRVLPSVMAFSGGQQIANNTARALNPTVGGGAVTSNIPKVVGQSVIPTVTAQAAQEQLPEDSSPMSKIAAQLLGGMVGGYATALSPTMKQVRNVAGNVKSELANALTGYKPKFDPSIPTAPTAAERMQAQQQVVKPRIKLNSDGTKTVIQEAQPTVTNQYKQPPQPFDVKDSDFVAPSGNLAKPVQQKRIELMKELGLDTMRPAAVTGNQHNAGIEYETTKLSHQSGQVMREQLAKEQQALRNYADNIYRKTGANHNLSPEDTGRTIREPARSLNDWFDQKVTSLYDQAKQNAGELGQVKPENLNKLLANPDFKETLLSSPAGTTLLGSIERQVARFKGIPVDGVVSEAQSTVNSAEALRKWLNSQWSPGNSALIGKVKEAIDMDVANVGGGDVYKAARQLHQQRKQTIDNPEGISLLNQKDKYGGINESLYDEKVPSKVLSMPTVQFKHIVDTYKNMPEELQPQAQQALAEIKGAIAKELHTAGAGKTAMTAGANQSANMENWNPKNVSKRLNELSSKINLVFTPEEQVALKNLHDAGYILAPPKAYKGAAAQEYNFAQNGLIKSAMPLGGSIGSAIGYATGGPAGAVVGGGLGSSLGLAAKNNLETKIQNSMAKKLAERLKSPKPSED